MGSLTCLELQDDDVVLAEGLGDFPGQPCALLDEEGVACGERRRAIGIVVGDSHGTRQHRHDLVHRIGVDLKDRWSALPDAGK